LDDASTDSIKNLDQINEGVNIIITDDGGEIPPLLDLRG